MIPFNEIINYKEFINHSDKKYFKMNLKWPNGKKEVNYLPCIKAPFAAVDFWINYLNLTDLKYLYNFTKVGFCSRPEVFADVFGFYKFYSVERWIPLEFKRTELPVFDINDDDFIKHKTIELKPDNLQMMYNNGFAPALIHISNMGVEQINGMINQTQLYKSWQNIATSYTRAVVLKLSINLRKFNNIDMYIKKKISFDLYQNFDLLNKKILGLHFIQKEFKNKLIPTVQYNKSKFNDFVSKKLKNDKLRFNTKWEHFDTKQHMILIEWLLKQSTKWKLNDDSLHELFLYFKKRFRKEILREKCFKYGIEFFPK